MADYADALSADREKWIRRENETHAAPNRPGDSEQQAAEVWDQIGDGASYWRGEQAIAAALDAARDAEAARWKAKIEAVHVKITERGTSYCDEDGHIWPCRTMRALLDGDR